MAVMSHLGVYPKKKLLLSEKHVENHATDGAAAGVVGVR